MTAPISGYVGPNGSGKTLAAMALGVAPAIREGREVVATCWIDHPRARLLESWREIDSLKSCYLLLDEITSQLPSRQAMQLPPQLARRLNQLRKDDVEVAWTAPNWARADVLLREVTQEVTLCRGFWPDRWERERGIAPLWRPLGRRIRVAGRPQRVRGRWAPNRLFAWSAYDATAFDEFTLHRVKRVKPRSRVYYFRPWQPEQWLYDTLQPVSLMDHLDDIGLCVRCGGVRRRPTCRCVPEDGAPSASPQGELGRPPAPLFGGDT